MPNHGDLVFPREEYDRRIANLRASMEKRGLDAVVLAMPHDLFYLTGYQTPGYYWFQVLVVPLAKEPFMVTRLLESSNIPARTWITISRPYDDFGDPTGTLADAMREFGLDKGRIGIDEDAYFFRSFEQKGFKEKLPNATFVNCTGIVEQLRVVKSDLEIAKMERSARATEAGMRAGIEASVPGANEDEIAASIYDAMLRAGSEWPAMAPFIATGWRGAVGHMTWEHRQVEQQDYVFLEVAGCYNRYHTAMMRTISIGETPQAIRDGEQVCLEAMQATMEAIKPGVPASDIDVIARDIIAKAPVEQAARTAYSIGIGFPPDWGEGHILSMMRGHDRPLEKNMTFHLIPWVQVPGHGGVGITETIVVTEDGCRSLFDFEKKVFSA
ncbi:M24 family metallopeptidase [Altererythrobacter sp.]|uniref:M24 family metallopeptidase n=1 Tax=Altererythrobacter sp. TaxID=1872480 RepID=UPI003CFE7C30